MFTQPDTIREIHLRYFAAGADIGETNTFSGTTIAQADYAMEHVVYDLNKIGSELAVDAAKEQTAKEPHRPRLVAGTIGPTNRTLSISPSVEDPGARNCTWDEVVKTYKEQVPPARASSSPQQRCSLALLLTPLPARRPLAARSPHQVEGLVDGGVHILMVETIFDSLNAKAALSAIDEYYEESGCPRLPVTSALATTRRPHTLVSPQPLCIATACGPRLSCASSVVAATPP